jgi:hypothetical protein
MENNLKKLINEPYKYGFSTNIETEKFPYGITGGLEQIARPNSRANSFRSKSVMCPANCTITGFPGRNGPSHCSAKFPRAGGRQGKLPHPLNEASENWAWVTNAAAAGRLSNPVAGVQEPCLGPGRPRSGPGPALHATSASKGATSQVQVPRPPPDRAARPSSPSARRRTPRPCWAVGRRS